MVESPTAAIYEPVTNEDPDSPLGDKKIESIEPELILVKQSPITSTLRNAIRHLRERGGRLARFRGLSLFVFYHTTLARLTNFLAIIPYIPIQVSAVVAAVALAQLRTGWVHIVMSDPSPKTWMQRLPSWKIWTKVALPTAILAATEQITCTLPMGLWFAFGLQRINDPQQVADMSDAERKLIVLKALAVVLLMIFSAVAIVVPAMVSLTRVQASLISEEEETIVPFDRSFGGRVVPAVVGGSGVIGILEAWKTFDWNSRVRLLKIYAKVFTVQVAMVFLMAAVVGAELHFIMGEEFGKYVNVVFRR
jgi:hypothetical protein